MTCHHVVQLFILEITESQLVQTSVHMRMHAYIYRLTRLKLLIFGRILDYTLPREEGGF